MSNLCFNYDSGEYEHIDSNGFSIEQGDFMYNWDSSSYQNEDDNTEDDKDF